MRPTLAGVHWTMVSSDLRMNGPHGRHCSTDTEVCHPRPEQRLGSASAAWSGSPLSAMPPLLFHSLHPFRPRRSGFERVAEILRLAGHLAVHEFHDAHRVGRPAIIGEDEFRHPDIARANDPAHPEPLCIRLRHAGGLNVVTAPDALARLRIFEQCVLSVYIVLDLELVCVRRGPVAIERLSNL